MNALRPQRHFGDVPQNVKDGTGYEETKLTPSPPTRYIGTLTHGFFDYRNDLRMVGELRVQPFLDAQKFVVLSQDVGDISDLPAPGIETKSPRQHSEGKRDLRPGKRGGL